jgi:hypothetical protein
VCVWRKGDWTCEYFGRERRGRERRRQGERLLSLCKENFGTYLHRHNIDNGGNRGPGMVMQVGLGVNNEKGRDQQRKSAISM